MRPLRTPLLAAALGLAACAAPEPGGPHMATVTEVLVPRGALMTRYLRPNGAIGEGPLTVIRLRIGGNGRDSGRLLEIDHVGAYDRALMGGPGDRVVFTYEGPLPARGEIDEASILSYEVLP